LSLRAVIFDFGGVLARTRSQVRREAWSRRLNIPVRELNDIVFGAENGYAAQLGQWTDDVHWDWIGRRIGLSGDSLERFRSDFFADDVLDIELLAHVDRLRAAGYHVGLLSNASGNARQIFRDRYDLLDHFDSVTISAEEGIMKPDPRIFHTALVRAGVEPEQALFVDDFIENVDGARALGMHAVHFQDPASAQRAIADLTGTT
jgi:HAD superfamily hydrolase (TIGR01509 family)